jgi:hypothetical protein
VSLLKSIVRLCLLPAILVGAPGSVVAQDSTAVPRAVVAQSPDTLRPPISPGRAFLHSLILPGSAQNRLGRHRVAVGIVGVEVMSIAMIRESGADVREARRQQGDSLVMSYVDANGTRLTAPVLERRRFGSDEVSSRRSHVEDWIALLVANHLFAASEAFVAASLWDVGAHVNVSGDRNNLMIGARIEW